MTMLEKMLRLAAPAQEKEEVPVSLLRFAAIAAAQKKMTLAVPAKA